MTLKNILGDEIWRDIPSWRGVYQASSFGQIRSIKKNGSYLLRKQFKRRNGYCFVGVCGGGIQKTQSVHRLVYEAFHGEIPEGLTIDHINHTKDDNRPENLCVMTFEENHAKAMNRMRAARGIVREAPMKKFFRLNTGTIADQDEFLLLVGDAVNPSDEHYITFLATFDAMVDLLRCNTKNRAENITDRKNLTSAEESA
jgi:hypothetical protein